MSATDETGWTLYAEPIRGRTCGTCKACCTQVPAQLDDGLKTANERCKHLCSRGCSIYGLRPDPCRYWSCRWLFDPHASELRRPDRGGYIVDPVPMEILVNKTPKTVLQIWVDPQRPDAHRDEHLRAYLADMAERHGFAAIVRYAADGGFVLVAPVLSGQTAWIEKDVNSITHLEMQQTLASVAESG